MPAVNDEAQKGRAQLFRNLDRAGAHFISVESGSSSPSSLCSSSDDEEQQSLASLVALTKGEEKQQSIRGGKGKATVELGRSREEAGNNTMSMRYSRVTSSEAKDNSPISEAEQSKRRRSRLAEKISNKLHALFWAVVGVGVAYQTDFVRVLMEDERVDRIWFNIGIICFSINLVILAYLTVWLPHVRGIKVSWNVYSPRAIPTATFLGIVCAIMLNISLWAVWGFLTPLIIFAVFIGCLFSLHFVPWPC